MGLLDSLTEEQRGGLLAMGAAMMQPTRSRSFGESLSNGLMTYGQSIRDAQDREQQRKMQALQMGNLQATADLHKQQAALAQQKAAQDQKRQEMLSKLFAPPDFAGQSMGMGAAQGSIGPTMDNAQRMTALQNSPQASTNSLLQRLTPDVLGQLMLTDPETGKNMLSLRTEANKVHNMQPGWNINGLTGQREWTGKYEPGMMPGPNGSMQMQPGADQTIAGLEAAKAGATERAKLAAQHGFGRTEYIAPGGATVQGWTADVMGTPPALRGQSPAFRPPAPGSSEGKMRQGMDLGSIPPEGASQAPGNIAAIKAELAATNDPQKTAILMEQLQKNLAMMQGGSGGVVVKPSALQQKAQETVIEADKGRLEAANKQAASLQATLSAVDRIEGLMKQGVYQGGLGDMFSTFAQNSGLNDTLNRSDPKAIRTRAMQQAGEGLIVADGLGTAVSNEDARRYERARGELNKPQSDAQRYQALATIREITTRAMQNANSLREGIKSGSGAPEYKAPEANMKWQSMYKSEADAIADARNALMKAPTKRREIIQRLEELGVTNHGWAK